MVTHAFAMALALAMLLIADVRLKPDITELKNIRVESDATSVTVAAQQPDPQMLGPKVGERVSDFSLPDQHGVVRPLRSMFGSNGAVLVFFRSADW